MIRLITLALHALPPPAGEPPQLYRGLRGGLSEAEIRATYKKGDIITWHGLSVLAAPRATHHACCYLTMRTTRASPCAVLRTPLL